MADKRTIRRIIKHLAHDSEVRTTVEGYVYYITQTDDVFFASPTGSGDDTDSTISEFSYIYTHGGKIFRRATELCWELAEEYRKKVAMKEENQFADEAIHEYN